MRYRMDARGIVNLDTDCPICPGCGGTGRLPGTTTGHVCATCAGQSRVLPAGATVTRPATLEPGVTAPVFPAGIVVVTEASGGKA